MNISAPKSYLPFITAGFPSPAQDFTDLKISLDKTLIRNPAATFMAYADGDSMIRMGIHHGDLLIVDRSLETRDGDVVVAVLDGEFLIKQFSYLEGKPALIPYNSKYPIVYVSSDADFRVWGVVVHSIRTFR